MAEHMGDAGSKVGSNKESMKNKFNKMSKPKRIWTIIGVILIVVLIIALSGFGIWYIMKGRSGDGTQPASSLHSLNKAAASPAQISLSAKASSTDSTEELPKKTKKTSKKGKSKGRSAGSKSGNGAQANLLGVNDIHLVSMNAALSEKAEEAAK